MEELTIRTVADATFGILATMTVQGYHNAKCLVKAMENLNAIIDAIDNYEKSQNEKSQKEEAQPHDADDGQGQDV